MKIRTKITIVAIALALMAFACGEKKSPILSKKVKINNIVEISEDIKSDNIMSREDISFFLSALDQKKIDEIDGKTVGEIINEVKTNNTNKLKNNLITKASQRVLAESLAFGVPKKNAIANVQKDNKIVQHRLTLNFKNTRDKDIKEFIGRVIISWKDKNGNQRKAQQRFAYGNLKAGETKQLTKAIAPNRKSIMTVAMITGGTKTIEFVAEKVTFADDQVVSVLKEK